MSLRGRAVAVLGLLAVVAAASAARAGGGGSSPAWLVIALVAPLIALAVLLAAGGLLALGYAALGARLRTVVVGGVLAFLVAAPLAAIALSHWHRSHGQGYCYQLNEQNTHYRQCKSKASGGAEVRRGGGVDASETSTALLLAAGSLVVVVLLVGGAVLLVRKRGGRSEEPGAEEPFAVVLAESLDDLRAEQDVRRAIIACYARMERALARVGRGRRPAEAPLEFLRRVLVSVAPAAGGSLTDLFERAAFSLEPMGAAERERAIAALEALRGAGS